MKRILCLWFPNWPVQRLLVAQPRLRNRPLVLYRQDARRGRLVAYCDRLARQQGVRAGMRLTDAQALIGNDEPPASSLQPRFLPHDPRADLEALEELADWCEQFSPLVGVEPVDRPEDFPRGLLLDVTGLAELFGGEDSLARRAVSRLQGRGYHARAAIADTVGTAWAASRFAPVSDGTGGASESSGADGRPTPVTISPPGGSESTLDPLPPAALRLLPETVELLARLGISRIGQLRKLPRSELAARLGAHVTRRLDQATGAVDELIVAHHPPAVFRADRSLEYPTAHRRTLDRIVERLVEQVADRLGRRQRGAVRLVCSLRCGNSSVDIRVGLFQPTADARHLISLLRMQLELLAVPGAVEHVHVEVPWSGRLERRQRELFAAERAEDEQGLAVLVDRLSSRLGRQRVVRARLRASAHPESAYSYVPLAGNRPRVRRDSGESSVGKHEPGQRPLCCYVPPLPIEVVAVVPLGPPVALHYRNRRFTLARHWGPERIETRWWRGQSVRRDYFRVETETGQRFWIFRRLQDLRWFLQGEFE